MKINIQSASVDCVFLTYHSRPERSSKHKCFAFRPQPALPRKLDSVNLVPRGYFRLYKRPRGIRQKKD